MDNLVTGKIWHKLKYKFIFVRDVWLLKCYLRIDCVKKILTNKIQNKYAI